MKLWYYLVLASFLSLNVFALTPDIVHYKDQNIKKINSYLQTTEEKTIWQLLELLKLDELGQIKSIAIYPLLKETIENYRRTSHYVTVSDWIGLFSTYLKDTYNNANIYQLLASEHIDAHNSYPIDLQWGVVPQSSIKNTSHIALSYHARNGKIISPERVISGVLPYSIDVKIIIDDFIDQMLETDEIIENIFRSLKNILKSSYNDLTASFIARSNLNSNLLDQIITRIKNDELPISPVMTGLKTQDPVTEMLHRWDWFLNDNTSKYYSLLIVGTYLSKASFFTPPNEKPYFIWPQMEDFSKFKKFFMLSIGENPQAPEEETKYFSECYKDTLKRFDLFKSNTFKSENSKMRIQNLPNFLPNLMGLSSPVRMTIFQNCFNTDTWQFTDENKCYEDNKQAFQDLFIQKNKFSSTLEKMWTHIVQLLKVYYDRGFITYEEYNSRKIELTSNNFFDTDLYSIITRLFLDSDISIIDNRLLLQMANDQIYEETLVYALKKLLTHFDNTLVNLADLYLTKDTDLIFTTKQILTKPIMTIDKDIIEIPVKYIDAQANELSFKQDRDLVWGLLLSQAPLPLSRTQIQGSCATNAFLNVYSRIQKNYPEIIPWKEKALLDTLVSYSSNEWADLRDGMRDGRDHNFYDGVLRKVSNNSLTWVYASAVTREETKNWLEEKFLNGQAVYFGTKINYDGFPFLDIISGGGHAITLVGMSNIPEVTDEIYVFVSDSNNYYYTLPLELLLDYSQYSLSMDFGIASGDPSFYNHQQYGKNATLKTIEFIEN